MRRAHAQQQIRPSSAPAFRWLALGVLLSTTPVVQHAAVELACLVGIADECDSGCDGHGDCSGPCQTCYCCVHTNLTVAAALGFVPELEGVREPRRMLQPDGRAEGHGSLPFRPPSA